MPHDVKKNELKVGDTVIMRAKVIGVSQSEYAGNMTVQIWSLDPLEYAPIITCNAKLCEKLEPQMGSPESNGKAEHGAGI